MWTKIFLRVGVFILCHFSPSFLWRCIKWPAGVFVPSLPLSLSIAIHFLSVRHPREIFLSPVDGRNCGYLYLFYLNCLCLCRARERADEKSGELRRKANDLSRNNKQEKRFFFESWEIVEDRRWQIACFSAAVAAIAGQKISMNEHR